MQTAKCPHQHLAISCGYDPQNIHLSSMRALADQAASIVATAPLEDFETLRRAPSQKAYARQVAMYLAHVIFGLTLTQTGRLFARDRTTVAHGCGVVEDRRDDPVFDRALDIAGAALKLRTDRLAALHGRRA